MRRRMTIWTVAALFLCNSAFAQQSAGTTAESHKNRTIFTIVGLGGGFAAGLFGGLAAFDDARYAESKVTLTAILGAAGGGVGGYFIGRALDRRHNSTTVTWSVPAGRTYPPVESLNILPSVFKKTSTLAAAKAETTSCADDSSTPTPPNFELLPPEHIGTLRALDCRRGL